MLTKDFIKYMLDNQMNPVLCVANDHIFEDLGLEKGCKFYVTGFSEDYSDSDSDSLVYKFELDFSEFEEYNKKFLSKEWYGKNHELVYWYESIFYPKSLKVDLYSDYKFDCGFDVFVKSKYYKQYEESGFTGDYVEYLEYLVEMISCV